jgi:hypothetical protein
MAVALLLLAGLAIDAWHLPPRQSTVGQLLHPYARGMASSRSWGVVRLGGQWVAVNETNFYAIERTLEPDEPRYTVWHHRRYWTRGFWAPTRQTRWNELHFYDGSTEAEPPAAVRRVAAAYLRDVRGADPTVANPLALGDQYADRIIWAGWLHTLLALAAFVAALVLMPWRAIAIWWRGRPPEPGVCAGCGYDLSGLAGARCPECGLKMGRPPGGEGAGA